MICIKTILKMRSSQAFCPLLYFQSLFNQNFGCLSTFRQRRQWHPTPVLLPGESQGWRSLVGCCLWGRTESDTTEAP